MAIIGIVAIDRRGAIGQSGGLPWHYPADMRFFREQTTGHACVMGRKTWLTLKRPLRERLNIVLTRAGFVEPPPAGDSEAPLVVLREAATVPALDRYLACDLYVIGGAEIFRALGPHIERWTVTEIPLVAEAADTYMPADFLAGFELRETRQLADELAVKFYERAPRPSTS